MALELQMPRLAGRLVVMRLSTVSAKGGVLNCLNVIGEMS